MARASYIESLTGGITADLRLTFKRVADYFFNNLRFGVPVSRTEQAGVGRAENFQLYCFAATTPSTGGTEFSVSHNLGVTPYLLLPCLNLANVNEQLVPLTVSRAADNSRIYLTSTSTNAAIRFWLEVP